MGEVRAFATTDSCETSLNSRSKNISRSTVVEEDPHLDSCVIPSTVPPTRKSQPCVGKKGAASQDGRTLMPSPTITHAPNRRKRKKTPCSGHDNSSVENNSPDLSHQEQNWHLTLAIASQNYLPHGTTPNPFLQIHPTYPPTPTSSNPIYQSHYNTPSHPQSRSSEDNSSISTLDLDSSTSYNHNHNQSTASSRTTASVPIKSDLDSFTSAEPAKPIFETVIVERSPPFVVAKRRHARKPTPDLRPQPYQLNKMNPVLKEKRWTQEDYERLIQLREGEGLGWGEIARELRRREGDVKRIWERQGEWRGWTEERVVNFRMVTDCV